MENRGKKKRKPGKKKQERRYHFSLQVSPHFLSSKLLHLPCNTVFSTIPRSLARYSRAPLTTLQNQRRVENHYSLTTCICHTTRHFSTEINSKLTRNFQKYSVLNYTEHMSTLFSTYQQTTEQKIDVEVRNSHIF